MSLNCVTSPQRPAVAILPNSGIERWHMTCARGANRRTLILIDRGKPYEPPVLLEVGRLEDTFASIEDQREFADDYLAFEDLAESESGPSAGPAPTA